MRDYLNITPLDIQQHQFSVRFRGFDIREVDAFLDRIAQTLDVLYKEVERLRAENREFKTQNEQLTEQVSGYRSKYEAAKLELDQMNVNAKRIAESMLAEAEQKAEAIVNRAYNRMAQVHEDIIRLKTQRMQIEAQIRAVIESHLKLLDMEAMQNRRVEEEYEKLRRIASLEGDPLLAAKPVELLDPSVDSAKTEIKP
uniref:DivIVA domain-containing protein n=1 Tax=Desulfatirhabdium butyrativorans TaxID=340467 RepID=A0A7C4VSR5_9BACT